jgi:hypothetical protein
MSFVLMSVLFLLFDIVLFMFLAKMMLLQVLLSYTCNNHISQITFNNACLNLIKFLILLRLMQLRFVFRRLDHQRMGVSLEQVFCRNQTEKQEPLRCILNFNGTVNTDFAFY